MSKDRDVKINIHFGGSMEKKGDTYEYVGGRSDLRVVVWKKFELLWSKFEEFLTEEKVSAPIALIWFKLPSEGMEKLHYIFESGDGDMYTLRDDGEIDVYLEHLQSGEKQEDARDTKHGKNNAICGQEHNDGGSDAEEDRDRYDVEENMDAYDAEDEDGGSDAEDGREEEEEEQYTKEEEEEDEEEEEIDEEEIPMDDMDVEVSENEITNGIEKMKGEEKAIEVDNGEDVVEEVGDASTDGRFTSLFKEAEKAEPQRKEEGSKVMITNMVEDVREESDDSDLDYDPGAELYPDTPVDTDEEWERLKEKPKKFKKSKGQFHGDYDEEPYLWLFQKFNSGDEFKSQLLRYALKTQYDVKMAKSEGRRIAAVCCEEKCKWKFLCSIEVPINKWMVKVCHNTHNHSKKNRVRLLKQGVIACLYREELRRRVYMTANEIKDSIKERYNCIVSRSKCSKAKRIALDVILEDQATQFAKLWDYEAELKRSNIGITTEICTIPLRGEQVFDRFYICFEPLKTTWKNCCRPIIGLDGCFCRWDLKGELLAAVGRDADNRIYPIAWAIVRGEDNDTWANILVFISIKLTSWRF